MASKEVTMRFPILAGLAALALPSLALRSEDDSAAREARKNLPRAVEVKSNEEAKKALLVLIKAGGKENIESILKLLPKIPVSEDAIYWDLIQGAASFVDQEAMEDLGETIIRSKANGLSRDLIYGLAKNRSNNAIFALSGVLLRGPSDLQLMAAEKIATIPSPEAVDTLIAALKRDDGKPESDLREAVVDGLTAITGQKYGVNIINWEGWWKANRDKAILGRGAEKGDRGTGTVVDRLDKRREKQFQGLEKVSKKSVIVLVCERDECNKDLELERKLSGMGIPHQVVKRPDFEKFDLRGVGAIIIICTQFLEFCICPDCQPSGPTKNRLRQCSNCSKHIKYSARLSDPAIKKLQNFVSSGGSLFLEDWTVKEVLERAYPKYASTGQVLRADTVDVVPARGRASHPLLKGVFRPEKPPEPDGGGAAGGGDGDSPGTGGTVPRKPEEPKPKKAEPPPELVSAKQHWKIDDESWAIKIQDPSKVLVLLTSGKLQQTAEGEGVVAFCFRPGGEVGEASGPNRRGPGLVMHVLSHFGHQDSADDEYTLQNILLNFLLASNVAKDKGELAVKPKKGAAGKSKDGKNGKAEKPEKPEGEGKDGAGGE